jgi:hypothetical protein
MGLSKYAWFLKMQAEVLAGFVGLFCCALCDGGG